jgi:hypothetical protein
MFKISLKDQGGAYLFLPASFDVQEVVLGSGVKRSVNGKAHRQIIRTFHRINIGLEWLNQDELLIFHHFFTKNIQEGIIVILEDDIGNSYECMWASENFGIGERKQADDVYYSGSIMLEEL